MYTMTLEPNRSNPARFVATVRYERRGNKLIKVRRVFDGPGHIASIKEISWSTKPDPDKDWAPVYSGEKGEGGKGKHSRPYTIKRDWLRLHEELHWARVDSQERK